MSERRLAAILSADVAGYGRLMAEDEAGTIRTLAAHRDEIARQVRRYRGRVVDAPGDNLLAELPTALDAVECALAVQRTLAERNAPLPDTRRMEFRLGVHVGDVTAEGERIYGEGVNLAARLEALARPGGICLSQAVADQVRHKLDVTIEDLGERALKNLPEPVRVFRIAGVGSAPAKPVRSRGRLAAALAASGLSLAALALWLSWPAPLGFVLDAAGLTAPSAAPGLPDRPSLVVLPFANLSDDPEQEYFSDGMTEDLTSALASVRDLFVISRTSAFTYKGSDQGLEAIAAQLGVRYVLEGSARRDGERVRITAQLIDATTGFHVWAETYDRRLADVFAVQSEIVAEILGALQVQIREAEFERIARKPTEDLSAYDAEMRGLAHFLRLTREDNQLARKFAERAVEIDPDYADAYAVIGGTYNAEFANAWNLDPKLPELAKQNGRHALQLDPNSPLAYNVIGVAELTQGHYREALAAGERAVALAPGFDMAHFVYGIAQLGARQPLAALRSLQTALRLNPRAPLQVWNALGWVEKRLGRDAEAVALWERVAAANPDLISARIALAEHHAELGEWDMARDLVRDVLEVNPDLDAEHVAQHYGTFVGGDEAEVAANLRAAGLP